MITVEKAKLDDFNSKWGQRAIHPALRYGQALHHYLALEKTVQFKKECDRLYQLDGAEARAYAKQLFTLT